MKLKRILAIVLAFTMVLSTMSFNVFAEDAVVAKVGNTEYATIDEAIAAWTNGTTLTLLADVTLSDVIKLSSTESHVLDLGTYTMTAAKNKDAIQYVINGRGTLGYALDIKADATNPGGITATGGSVVRHNKPLSGAPSKDRPITRFYGGVFNASYVVRQGGSWGAGYTGASAPAFYFYGGEYNGTIYTNRSINQFYGGTFNGNMQMSVDSSAYTLVAGGTFKNLSNAMGSDLTTGNKFTIGSSKGANNGSVCIDENGNYVISTATPAEAEASVASNYNSSNYFYYSTVNTNGMYYEDVYDALEANETGEVTVFVDELDLVGSSFTGTIVVPEGEEITIIVEKDTNPAWSVVSNDANVTYTDGNGTVLEEGDDGSFAEPAPEGPAWEGEGTEEVPYLIEDVAGLKAFQASINSGEVYGEVYFKLTKDIDLAADAVSLFSNGVTPNWEPIGTKAKPFTGTFDGGGKTISNLIVDGGANRGFFGYANKATIKNINIENAAVTGTDCVGAIAGQVYSESLIDNCHVSGNIQITGQTNVGGIVGKYYTKVTNSSVIGNGTDTSFVKGVYTAADFEGDNVGGIMGHGGENNNFVGNIVKNITVSGTRKIGGIVGTTDRATDVSGCTVENVILKTTATKDYAAGNANSMALGGLIGHYYGDNTGGTVVDSTVENISFVKENDVNIHAGAIVGNNRTTPNVPVEGVTYEDNTVADVTGATNNYLQPTVTYVAEVNGVGYETLEEAIAAAQDGDTITLLSDVVLKGIISTDKSITIDGNNHKITPAADFTADGNGAVLVFANGKAAYDSSITCAVKNVTFEGFSGLTRVVRANFAKITIDNCDFNNNTVSEGVITSAYADLTVNACEFNNNTADFAVINVGSDVSNGTELVTDLTGNTFTGNNAAFAIVYLASSANVTDNYFSGNIHTGDNANTAAILAGPYTGNMEYTINVTQNAFDNAMSKDGVAIPAVFAEDWSSLGSTTAFELSSNYWDGIEPVEGVAYKTSGTNPDVTLNDYYTTYEDGVLSNLEKIASFDGVTITNLDELKMFRDAVNAGDNYAGKTVTLNADIDLAGEDWTPIGCPMDDDWVGFQGTFDGNGHTISNLKIDRPDAWGQGLFGYIETNATIKNVTVHNAEVTGEDTSGVIAGYAYKGTFTDCHVTGDVKVTGKEHVGGVVGNGYYANFSDCSVDANEGSYVKATVSSFAAGIVGYHGEGNLKIENCTVKNLDITAYGAVGAITGIAQYGNTITGCNVENVSLTKTRVDGLASIGLACGTWTAKANGADYTTTITNNSFKNVSINGTAVSSLNLLYGSNYSGSTEQIKLFEDKITCENIDTTNFKLIVAKIGSEYFVTLDDAVAAAKDGETVTLIWNEGSAPIAMNGAVYGKSVTITGDAVVDWSKGFLFVGRGGEGNGTVIFDNANLKSASNSSSYGIHVSGREKDTDNKYDGTLTIIDSEIELDYLINKGNISLDNSSLTVKNGFAIGGRPASETEEGVDATATIDLKNGSKVVVNNHNGMGLGYEAIGIMNIDKTSAFKSTQNFLITAKGTMNVNGGNVNVEGNLEVKGTLKSNGNVFGNIVAADTAVIEITGGLYTQDVSQWCADGYKCEINGDGTYSVNRTELFKVAGTTTSLDSSLALNIYLESSYLTGEDYYAIVEHAKATGEVVTTNIPYTDWVTSGNYKVIRYTGIAAKEMADELTITIYDSKGTQVSETFKTSLRDYALSTMNRFVADNETSSLWLPALTDMLNYGAAAQIMFNYNTGDLASAGAEEFKTYASSEYTLDKDGCVVSGSVVGTTLTLEDMIKLNVYFKDVTEGMYAKYSYTTHAGTSIEKTVDYASFVNAWGYLGVSVDDIAIADAATLVKVTMYNSDDSVAGTAEYSVNAYLKDMIDKGEDDPLYPALAKFAGSAKKAFAEK